MEKLKRIGTAIGRFKYPALVLLIGAALLLWPSKKEAPVAPAEPEPQCTLEAQLSALLSRVEGAGQVEVLLTKQSGDENIYQTDTTQGEGTSTVTTVMGGEAPVLRQTLYGKYQGALVVCQGADSAAVRLNLVNAVAGLTGLSTDCITVIKMQEEAE